MNDKLFDFQETLSGFIAQLEKSGKADTANFYRGLLDQVNNDVDPLEALDKVINSGAISQYANLSFEEDKIFEKLHEKALRLKGTLLE